MRVGHLGREVSHLAREVGHLGREGRSFIYEVGQKSMRLVIYFMVSVPNLWRRLLNLCYEVGPKSMVVFFF